MKIAVTSTFGWPYVRRGSRFTYELASYLAQNGHEVNYITTKPGIKSRTKKKDNMVIEYHRLIANPILPIIKAQNLDTFVFPCLHSLLQNDYDIVQTVLPMDAFAARIAKNLKGTPFVHYMIDRFQPFYFVTGYGKFMLKKSVSSAAMVTAPSSFIIDDVRRHFGIDSMLTPPAVDTAQFTLCEDKDLQNPRILFTSSIHDPRKGFLILVKAFEKLLEYIPGARLQLSGHVHPKAIEIVYESVGNKAKSAIEILGVGRREDLPELYRQAAVTVLPSLNEAFGMVLLESLASGTPIVGTNSGGIPDILSNTEIGVLFDSDGGPEGLCEAIMKAIEMAKDPFVWKKCRNHAESFSWDRIGPRFEKLYSDIIDSNGSKEIRKHKKSEEVSKTSTNEFNKQNQQGKTKLNKLFDDVLDEIEVDYDNYFRIDQYKPFCTYILGWLLNNGIQSGNVLVVSSFTFPLTMLLEKCDFNVKGIGIAQKSEPWNNPDNQMFISDVNELKDLSENFDVVIFDDTLRNMDNLDRCLQILRDKIKTKGFLLLTTGNVTDIKTRLYMQMRKNNCTFLDGDLIDKTSSVEDKKQLSLFKGYNLGEVERLVSNSSFSLSTSKYIMKEKVIKGSFFPIPAYLFFYKTLYCFVQKICPCLRSHIFIAAQRISVI